MNRLALLGLLTACNEYNLKGEEGPSDPAPVDTAVGALLVTPLELDFGVLPINSEMEYTVTASNVGVEDIWLDHVELLDTSAPFRVTFTGSPLLIPGASTTFLVGFAPDEPGAFTGIVEVASDAPYDGTQTVSLIGATGYPHFVVEPEHHDFGTLDIGDRAEVDVIITNDGDEAGVLSDPAFSSTSATELFVQTYGELYYSDLTLAPGESTTVTVAYAPTDSDPDEGTFTFSTNAPDQASLAANFEGNGVDPCADDVLDVTMTLTADDAWDGWLDGVEFTAPNQSGWSSSDTVSLTSEPGCTHVLAFHAYDIAQAISGFKAILELSGEGVSQTLRTGTAPWVLTPTEPPDGWTDPDFDDSDWVPGSVCANPSIWGSSPIELYDPDIDWIWWDADCTVLGDAWLRLRLPVEE